MLSPEPDAAALLDALHFASAKHRDQRRQDSCGSPFVNHPIETAWLLARVGGVRDRTVLMSAILHDILEDTTATPADLERRFGVAVRRLVEDLTDEAGLPTDHRRRQQLARVARASCEAKQIRLADKIANLRSLPVQWSKTECEQYVDFAEQVAAAVRGANAHLDRLFAQMAQRARMAIRAGGGNGSARPSMPAMPTGCGSKGDYLDPLLRLLQRRLSKAEELVDTIVMGRGGGDKREPRFEPGAVANSSGQKRRRHRPRRFADPALKKLAEPGIGSVEFRKIDARYVAVSIDGAKEFPLPIGLAHLLAVIASAEGDSTDGFTPFQSRREVAVRLEKLIGRPQADHTIVVAIGRLRWLLQTVGNENPLFVQTDGQNVRLRLRRVKP